MHPLKLYFEVFSQQRVDPTIVALALASMIMKPHIDLAIRRMLAMDVPLDTWMEWSPPVFLQGCQLTVSKSKVVC